MKEDVDGVYILQINLNVWTHLVIHLIKPSKQRWCLCCTPLCIRVVMPAVLRDLAPLISGVHIHQLGLLRVHES